MLDEANQDFINLIVTLVRYAVYFVVGMITLRAAWKLLSWLWKCIRPSSDKDELEKAKRGMRDLGY